MASSGAHPLRPEGISVRKEINAPVWFQNDEEDVRSSYYLDEVASKFDVQGLELDWGGVAWDADFRYVNGIWQHSSFKGTRWRRFTNLSVCSVAL